MNNLISKLIVLVLVSIYTALSGIAVQAADTEIFYADPPANQEKPNLLFIMSTGGTMSGGTTPPADCADSSKIGSLKCILKNIADTEDRVNMGLMRFSKPGGPVLYPIVDLSSTALDVAPVTTVLSGSDNDITQVISTGVMDTNATDIVLGATDQVAAFRFENVNIPQGATVTRATLRFTVSNTIAVDEDAAGEFDILVEQSSFPAEFDSLTPETLLDRTTMHVPWLLSSTGDDIWTVGDGNDNAIKSSPEITTEINTIVNSPNWCGSGINIMIKSASTSTGGTRTIRTIDYREDLDQDGIIENVTDYAPSLYIEWDDSSIDPAAGEGCFTNTIAVTLDDLSDDAEDTINGLSADTSDIDLAVEDLTGANPDTLAVGLLFRDINIPSNATVFDAYITMDVKDTDNSPFSTTIGALQDPSFTTWADGFSAEPVGTTVNWNESTDTNGNGLSDDGNWAVNDTIRSPNISALITQVVGLASWSNNGVNNNIALKLTSSSGTSRRLKSADSASPARLFVTYVGNYDGASVREEVKAAIDDYKLVSNQPTTETYLEGYEYYTGGAVNYGGYRGSPPRTTNRVSHPLSYTDGALDYGSNRNETTCLANYPEHRTCKGETIVAASTATGAAEPTYIAPPMGQCSTNNIVLLSDGSPSPMDDGAYVEAQIASITGQTCSDNDGEDCSIALSEYLANNDINPNIDEDQLIVTHAIHFGADNENKYSFGKAVAEAGDGMFLIAEDGPALEAAFETLITSLAKVNTSFVSAGITVNQSNRLTHRDELYFSLFRPEAFAIWPGNVKRYRIFGDTILDNNDTAAIETGADVFVESAQSWWSAEADGNDASKGGAAEQLDFSSSSRVTFSNLTGDSNITPSGNNMVNTTNTSPGGGPTSEWETLLGTSSASQSNAVLSWIMGQNVDVDSIGNFTVASGYHNIVGDPLHSKPTILTYRGAEHTRTITDSEGNEVTTNERDMVFVGTNHGFLHAFYTDDGTEEWSFIPKELLNNVRDYVRNEARLPESHEYGVDGSITIYIDDTNGDGAVDVDDGERVYLYVGLRRGGSSYYAFDVTDYDQPELMFVINDPNPSSPGDDYDELGQTWSKPVVAKLASETGSRTDTDGTTYELAMVFGGGYDTNQDPTVVNPDGGSPSPDTSGRTVYMANALTGAKIWDARSHAQQYTQAGSITLMNSVPADVKAIDPRKPGYFEHLYVSDTLGQVFRFDIDTDWDGSDPANLSQGGLLAEIQTTADGTACTAESCNRRFYYTPDISIVPRPNGNTFVAVSLGSGYRARPLGTSNDDHFYVLRDFGVLSQETETVDGNIQLTGFSTFDNNDSTDGTTSGSEVITLANLVNVTNLATGTTAIDTIESTSSPKAGFYIEMAEGEKVLAESLTFNNRVIFTTYIPPDSNVSACTPQQGSGRAYAINITDGKPVVDLNNDGFLNGNDRYVDLNNIGIPPEPQVIVLGDGPQLLIGRQLATELIDVDWGEMDRIKWRERKRR